MIVLRMISIKNNILFSQLLAHKKDKTKSQVNYKIEEGIRVHTKLNDKQATQLSLTTPTKINKAQEINKAEFYLWENH